MFTPEDEHWMQAAIKLANKAAALGEVPVGAVIVRDNQLIAEGFNQPIQTHDASAHAEMMALRAAGGAIQNYRLVDTTLYVTIEPCMMCAGALVHARIGRLVFAAAEPRHGAVISKGRVLDESFLNHKVQYQHGLLATECAALMSEFFKNKRR
jgi:tRNA(adenine34) deaminase